MNEFKVGDKVKVKKEVIQPKYGWGVITREAVGTIARIIEGIIYVDFGCFARGWIADKEDLELAKSSQFTKSDLKDNHIVILKNGSKYIVEELIIEHYNDKLEFHVSDNGLDQNNIVSIWEFDKCVWKREEPQILDETEKRWLKHFIKSTNIEVCWIRKWCGASNTNEYLQIDYDTYFNHNNMCLPIFKKGTMYKNMELNKEYSLKDLGLEEK